MTTALTMPPQTRLRTLIRPRAQWLELALPLAFAAAVLSIGLWANAFEYDSDEGLNLMKALLLYRGHSLYTQVHSNQPPLMTWLLVGVFKVFGPSVLAARCLVLAFSTVMLWTTFSMVRRLEGVLTATIATLFLATTAWYMRLSFSVMIGLPSVALAVLAMCLAVHWRIGRNPLLLMGSALAMGLSLQIKLSSITAIPAIVMLMTMKISDDPEMVSRRRGIAALAAWAAIAATVCITIIIASGQVFDQVIRTHIDDAAAASKFKIQIYEIMKRDLDLLLLALVMSGIIVPLVETGYSLRRIVPLIWIGVVALTIQFWSPVWYHYVLLAAVPFSWAAAIGARPLVVHVRKMFGRLPGRWGKTDQGSFSIPSVILMAGVAAFFGYKLFSRSTKLLPPPDMDRYAQMGNELGRCADRTNYVLADRMIIPFRAGLLSAPLLGPAEGKRETPDTARDHATLSDLKTCKPEQILIGRRQYGPEVLAWINEHYDVAGRFEASKPGQAVYTHYVLKGLSGFTPRNSR